MKLNHLLTTSLLVLLTTGIFQTAHAETKHKAKQVEQPAAPSEPAAGAVWKEPKTGMEFAWMLSGCFQMGGDGKEREQPIHKVCVKGFWMGRTEVTQSQYQQIMGKNPSEFRGSSNPVENVNWQDAKDFAEEMSYTTGTKVGLPTEAQWEYACRAGGAHETYCGGGGRPERMAWYEGNSGGTTHPVAQLASNDWGLYDMSGNVIEWIADTYHDSYNGAPTDGSAWTQDGTKNSRMHRGGTYLFEEYHTHASYRSYDDSDSKGKYSGFRVVRTQP